MSKHITVKDAVAKERKYVYLGIKNGYDPSTEEYVAYFYREPELTSKSNCVYSFANASICLTPEDVPDEFNPVGFTLERLRILYEELPELESVPIKELFT